MSDKSKKPLIPVDLPPSLKNAMKSSSDLPGQTGVPLPPLPPSDSSATTDNQGLPIEQGRYKFDDLIKLEKSLPEGDRKVLFSVVMQTLGSLKVNIPELIEDGKQQVSEIQQDISLLQTEIGDLESELRAKKTSLASSELTLKDTLEVKASLEEASMQSATKLSDEQESNASSPDLLEFKAEKNSQVEAGSESEIKRNNPFQLDDDDKKKVILKKSS